MDPEVPRAHGNVYGGETWGNISPYNSSPYQYSPMNEYGHWGSYIPHASQADSHYLPAEPYASMSSGPPSQQPRYIKPAPTTQAMQHLSQLPMLNTAWPSQLTNPMPSGSYSAPALSTVTPVSSAQSAETPKPTTPSEKVRKLLTTEQKRQMCKYSEDNPGTRQADIGAKFGVERSTVSKVLRQKDIYLKNTSETENVPARKKGQDLDRTLSNHFLKMQNSGFEIKDNDILERAKQFAYASGHTEDFTSSWLLKFKQKHGIGKQKGTRLIRRASEANIPDSARMSTSVKKKRSMSGITSPTSATTQLSPLSESRSDEDTAPPTGLGLDLGFVAASRSSTSLNNDIMGEASFVESKSSSFGSGALSPVHRPEWGSFTARMEQNGMLPGGAAVQGLSQYTLHQPSMEPVTPHQPAPRGSPTLESPGQEIRAAPFAIDTNFASPPLLRRTNSSSSIGNTRSNTTAATSIDSSPTSPSHAEATRSATILVYHMQAMKSKNQSIFNENEFATVCEIVRKLQLQGDSKGQQPGKASMGGSLDRIPEGDGEINSGTGDRDMKMEMD
ncbi:uncharacterized protein F5Z01DRAFT_617613 [Emericellopsis atlantica]|uniref:HTH CENPB-type domain-containing protein n=1 Tax=Emericellopsis atlantica TaxID=2614577 RepID=A0A9P8CS03_9HYPO|nr:uncharacterized protein F5Z01DRAFT_617613 [Emericellopsis atlantica]KAG9257323.1 hypothetical protein F5Z01DRAFT_617613 [Emericellopsis atlantica]